LHIDYRFLCLTLNSLHLINYYEICLEDKFKSTSILPPIDFCLGCDAYYKGLIHRNGGSRCFSLRSGMAILFPFLNRLDSIRQPSRLAVSIVKQLHVLPFVMHACFGKLTCTRFVVHVVSDVSPLKLCNLTTGRPCERKIKK
jgi:hypothetical protein